MSGSMRRFLYSGFFVWVLFAIGAVGYLAYFGKKSLKFGIDLVGGSYIMLEVQEDDVIKNELADKISQFENALFEANIRTVGKPNFEQNQIRLSFETGLISREAETVLRKEDNSLTYSVQERDVVVSLSSTKLQKLIEEATQANIHILETRLNNIGLSEVHISQHGDRFIVVELPDVQDPYQAKMMIGKAAVLEFKIVEDSAPTQKALFDKYDGQLPEGTQAVVGRTRNREKEWYLVPSYTSVSGKNFKNASVGFGGEYGTDLTVTFEFDTEGGNRFHELTSKNIERPMAIVLDDEVIQVATIKSAIRSQGSITGNFSSDEAKALAQLLKSGAFKAKVTFVEERQIGPTLGQESINSGIFSCLVGLLLLLLFGVLVYRLSGFFAFLALVINLLILLVCLSFLGAALTLPGIAGMILTVGMAVDASILIYEEIREALRHGESVQKAISIGFSDAMMVILDANITTFIVAVVLFYFGTG
ncbi:protein translocase subunit SecD, partial [bacterium]|nr:protein translocase subunit SecD [bacterium]